MIALSTVKHNLFSCVSPGAAITDCHKLGGLKQQKSASHSSGDQSLNPGVGKALFCLFQLMVAPGVLQLNNEKGQKGPGLALRPGLSPQPVDGRLLFVSSQGRSSVHVCVLISSSQKDTGA